MFKWILKLMGKLSIDLVVKVLLFAAELIVDSTETEADNDFLETLKAMLRELKLLD